MIFLATAIVLLVFFLHENDRIPIPLHRFSQVDHDRGAAREQQEGAGVLQHEACDPVDAPRAAAVADAGRVGPGFGGRRSFFRGRFGRGRRGGLPLGRRRGRGRRRGEARRASRGSRGHGCSTERGSPIEKEREE